MTEINTINSLKIYTGGSYYYIKVEAGGSDAIVYDEAKVAVDDDAEVTAVYKAALDMVAQELSDSSDKSRAYMLAFLEIYNTLKNA